jgi:hypothetical protein
MRQGEEKNKKERKTCAPHKKEGVSTKSMKSVVPSLMQICRPHSKVPSGSVAYKTLQCIFMNLEYSWGKICPFVIGSTLFYTFSG